ncbi:MAG: hypothetical protein WDM88_11145 [Galbitalea sp.]
MKACWVTADADGGANLDSGDEAVWPPEGDSVGGGEENGAAGAGHELASGAPGGGAVV